jgi:integrase
MGRPRLLAAAASREGAPGIPFERVVGPRKPDSLGTTQGNTTDRTSGGIVRGSVTKEGTGRWSFVIDLPASRRGRRQIRRRGFPTRRAAQLALQELLNAEASGRLVEPSRLTVEDYLVEHWVPTLPSVVRPTTADTYARLVRRHVLPELGAVPLQKLQRADISSWIAALVARGLSPKSIRNIHGVLAKALSDAVDLELVTRNVATRPRNIPRTRPPDPRVWRPEETQRFLSETSGDRFGALWRFIAATGCRRGEALGLLWSDVDLERQTAVIRRQRTIAGGSIVDGAPKTAAGARTVAIDEGTVRALRGWRRVQAQERLLCGTGWTESGLVFTNRQGGGLWPQRVSATFKVRTLELELPHIGLHGLRHTAATFMIASGVNARVVQQRLGHANVSVTLGLYTHVLPAHDQEAAALLGRALDGIV